MGRHRQVVLFWLASVLAFERALNLLKLVWMQMQMRKRLVWTQPSSRAEQLVSLSPILSEPACWSQERASLPEPREQHPVDPQQAARRSAGTAR
jgi:hypothetical protein